jgi:tripartite-type tricarboxylate transporter receptor subunit TctC
MSRMMDDRFRSSASPRVRVLSLVLGFLLALGSAGAVAQSWPTKPVRLIVPFPAGAAPDVVARLVAAKLTNLWGQQVLVENRPGAGGIPGMATLVSAPADGYTLAFVPAAVVTLTPHLHKNPQFDVDRNLTPIAAIATGPMMVVVNPTSGVNSLPELVKAVKAKPGKLNFAAPQPNSVPHLTGEMLNRTADMQMYTVQYSGSVAATTATVTGEATITIDGLPALVPQVKAGKLRPIAVTSLERLPGFESVPTVAETFPGFESIGWFAVFGPAGVPAPIVERINSDVNKVLQMPDLIARFAELGVYPNPGSPKALSDFLQAQRALWKKVVQEAGLQPQ